MALPPRLFIIIYFTLVYLIIGKILKLVKKRHSGFPRLKLGLTKEKLLSSASPS